MSGLELVGRSSSHFTRTARIFALELGVAHAFRPVFDMTKLEAENYAGNPALKVPILVDEQGPLYGTENICKELVRRAGGGAGRVLMRGDSGVRAIANFEECTLHVMSAEVSVIMTKAMGDGGPPAKLTRSMENCLTYLDENLSAAFGALPADRTLSFVEVALFCVVTHLPFRQVMETARWTHLSEFCEQFGERESARRTPFRFDTPPE